MMTEEQQPAIEVRSRKNVIQNRTIRDWDTHAIRIDRIALLTGGGDKPYALGMAAALTSHGIFLDFIGSDDLEVSQLLNNARVTFLNLRRDQRSDVNPFAKVLRVLAYYGRLIRYAATAKPKIFHILWHNKFVVFDRTVLLSYYKLLGKTIVLTAHNVNAGKRDSKDSWLNRLSLKSEYGLSDHIFVHTEKMKGELISEFNISPGKVTVVPFGINNTVPNTKLSTMEAKGRLGLSNRNKTMLFFGNIAPYKGLEYLVTAFSIVANKDENYRLIIVGKPKGGWTYWNQIQNSIKRSEFCGRVIQEIEYVPDEQTELYFKAADVSILPYKHIFQSGVLFLGYSFGLPAIAADVGSLREEIIENKTGFVFKPRDPVDLARAIEQYFASELFQQLESRRSDIKLYANERYSWSKVATLTTAVYSILPGN
jgi:D-inositol-3-phosphate glycosyltransferase